MSHITRYKFYALLAVLLALRSVVPTGYMLEPPSMVFPLGFSLTLCPTQNRQLNFSALNDASGSHSHHKRHHHPVSANTLPPENDQKLDLSNFPLGCGLWLSSTEADTSAVLVPALFEPTLTRDRIALIETPLGTPSSNTLIRGPPPPNRFA